MSYDKCALLYHQMITNQQFCFKFHDNKLWLKVSYQSYVSNLIHANKSAKMHCNIPLKMKELRSSHQIRKYSYQSLRKHLS
jgi:hypothetical protein